MVNLYDSYEQSKVMNIIPDSSKELLKANKEALEMRMKMDESIEKLRDKYNMQFASSADAAEVAGVTNEFESSIASIMTNPSLDSSAMYEAVASKKNELSRNRRLMTIGASNARMIKEEENVPLELQDYYKRSVRPYLRTSNDGTVWTGDFKYDPAGDWNKISSEVRAQIQDDTLKRSAKGEPIVGINKEMINNYIDNNYERLLDTHKGAMYMVVDQAEKTLGRRIDVTKPEDAGLISDSFKKVLTNMFVEYDKEREMGSNKTVIHNNMPKLDTAMPAIENLYGDPEINAYLSKIGSHFGASTNKDDSSRYDVSDISNKYKAHFANASPSRIAIIRTPLGRATSNNHSKAAWTAQATFVVSTKENRNGMAIDAGDVRITDQNSIAGKDVTIFPDMSKTNLVALDGKGNGSPIGLGREFNDKLTKLGNEQMVSMPGNAPSNAYIMMDDGSLGSIAAVRLRGDDAMTYNNSKKPVSSAEYLFSDIKLSGSESVWDKVSEAGPGVYEFALGGSGVKFTVTKIEVKGKEPKEGEKKAADDTITYYQFDVAKTAGAMSGPSLAAFGYNNKLRGDANSTYGGGQSNTGFYSPKVQ